MRPEAGGLKGVISGEGGEVDGGGLLEDTEVLGLGNKVFHRGAVGVGKLRIVLHRRASRRLSLDPSDRGVAGLELEEDARGGR
ncbi:hypothetical protein NL676_008880 [Syzygium grande]|nr:hypothetical protein NL676_008880 [Syzygium grande]